LRGAHQVLRKYAIQGGMLVVPYLAVLLAFPKLALITFYGSSSPYLNFQGAVRICALGYLGIFVAQVFGSHLSGMERVDLALRALFFSTVAAVLIGLPLTARMGVVGAVWGVLVVNAVRCFSTVALSQEKYLLKSASHVEAVTPF
jgi:O-antigen/teichoic acid export membrane protein